MRRDTTIGSRETVSDEVTGAKTPILAIYGEHDKEGLRQVATGGDFARWHPKLSEPVCPAGHHPMLELSADCVSAFTRLFCAD